jgi:3-methylcrotonyl-CoA carboxylase alpha subunit
VAEHEVRVGDITRRIDDKHFAIERIAEGIYSVSDGVRRWRVVVAGPPTERWLFVDGRVAQIELVDKTRTARRVRTAVHDMSAPMPATVVKVLVEPGAHVTRGDTVVMLEAMKMELPVKAARDGVVRAIRCQPGELVQPGVNLVELEA